MKRRILNIIFIVILFSMFLPTIVEATELEGLINDNGNTYYYVDSVLKTGFQEIGGKTYFFSQDKTRYGVMRTGVIQIGEQYYAFSPELKTGMFEYNGNTYYANEKGQIQVGFQVVGGKTYFFSQDETRYGVMRTGVIQIGEQYYAFSPELKTGMFEYNGNTYYTNEEGKIQVGFQAVGGKTYFFSQDKTRYGLMRTGIIQIGEQYYAFSPELKTGMFEYNGNTYYSNEEGKIQLGFQEIEGKTCFFSRDKTKYGAMRTGMINIGENYYYLNPEAQTGWIEYNGNTYYSNEEGEIQLGFQEIEGKTYFFSRDKTKYGAMRKGWLLYDNNNYYLDTDGAIVTGSQVIESREYFFSNDGILQGFKVINGKTYYYNPDGTMAKGVERLAGRYYKFDEITGAFEKYVNQKKVIDVSAHNGYIDWETVKNSGQVDAVILRLGYSIGFMDKTFLQNVAELNRLGIPYSVYLFSYAENNYEAELEAKFVVDTIKNNDVYIASDLFSIYYDLEDWYVSSTGANSYGISQETYGSMITTFSNYVENALRIKARVYASKNYINTRFPEYIRPYATWVAEWNDKLTYTGPIEGWQYSSNGSIPGINGRVDLNIFYY